MGIALIFVGFPVWIVEAIFSTMLVNKALKICKKTNSIGLLKYLPPALLGYLVSFSALLIALFIADNMRNINAQIYCIASAFIFPMIIGSILVGISKKLRKLNKSGMWVCFFNRFGIGFYSFAVALPVNFYIIHETIMTASKIGNLLTK